MAGKLKKAKSWRSIMGDLKEMKKDPEFVKYIDKLFKYHTGQISSLD